MRLSLGATSRSLFAVALAAGAVGCGNSVNALSGDGGAGSGGYDGPTLGVDGGGKIPVGSTQCSDGIDNDGDGSIDYDDPECVGPLDNDESSFATGIPGDNVDPCKQDCFFDGNSGMGDDGCQWQLKCDPSSVEAKCPYDSAYAAQHATECSTSASQSQTCVDKCQGAGAERLRLLRVLRDPRRPDHPARRELHRRRLRRSDEVPPLHTGDPVLEHLRPLRDLHRQADAPRRLHPGRRNASPTRLRRLHPLRPRDEHRSLRLPCQHRLCHRLLPAHLHYWLTVPIVRTESWRFQPMRRRRR